MWSIESDYSALTIITVQSMYLVVKRMYLWQMQTSLRMIELGWSL